MNIIEILKAVLFGIVEGVAEWLPISSTGMIAILTIAFSILHPPLLTEAVPAVSGSCSCLSRGHPVPT